jgi:hypothetical protein
MTPKEKAKELIEKYQFVYIQNYTSKHDVKQCALIVVDEIIDTVIGNDWSDPILPYWEEVKEEIENL